MYKNRGEPKNMLTRQPRSVGMYARMHANSTSLQTMTTKVIVSHNMPSNNSYGLRNYKQLWTLFQFQWAQQQLQVIYSV